MTPLWSNSRRCVFILWLILLVSATGFSQTRQTRDNYTGDWNNSASWNPQWTKPDTIIKNSGITIKGYITTRSSISFEGNSQALVVQDTLVIRGDLILGSNISLTIQNGGILIVRGDLVMENKTRITADGYLIITGDIVKASSTNQGSFTSNDNPTHVFLAGTVTTTGITNDNVNYPVLNQVNPSFIVYPGSKYPYGNMTDLANDPVFDFFQSTCTPATVNNNSPLCEGSTLNLTAIGGMSYSWNGPYNFTSTLQNPVISGITAGQSGTYQVVIGDVSGCTVIHKTHVDIFASPVIPIISATDHIAFCEGDSVLLKAGAALQYQWSTGDTSATLMVRQSGSFSVRVTDSHGCRSGFSVPVNVAVFAKPLRPAVTIDGATDLCPGATVKLSAPSAPFYTWSTGAKTRSILVSGPGNYSVQVSDANGCMSISSEETIVRTHSLPLVNAGADTTILKGTSVSLHAVVSGEGPFTYMWSPGDQLVDAGIEDPHSHAVNATTIFSLKVISQVAGCYAEDNVLVTVTGGSLVAGPKASPASICAGEKIQLFALAGGGSGTYTYLWTSSPSGFVSSEPNPEVLPLVSTVYTLDVSDGFTSVESQITVVVHSLPDLPVIQANGPLTFCEGDSVRLISTAGEGYFWSNGATTASITVESPGDYSVRLTDAYGCGSVTSQPVRVVVNPVPVRPVITADGPSVFCTGGQITLSSGSSQDCLWTTGETSPNITVTASGSYSLHVTSEEGCIGPESSPYEVTVNNAPGKPSILASGSLAFCEGDSVVLSADIGTSFHWSTGETGPELVIKQSGSYTLQVANANGCLSELSSPLETSMTPSPLATITSGGESLCVTDTRTLTATPEGGAFSLADGPGIIQNNVLTPTAAGTIQLLYSYSNGCIGRAKQSIIVNHMPVASGGEDQEINFETSTQMQAELSEGETGEWSMVSGSATIEDPTSPTTSISDLQSGENIFMWTVWAGSCQSAQEVRIVVHDVLIPSVITPNGDGRNDFFRIDYAGQLKLTIFNQWGNREYSSDNYENNWDGKSSKGTELPADTYYYLLEFDSGIVKKGFIYIRR